MMDGDNGTATLQISEFYVNSELQYRHVAAEKKAVTD